MLSLRPACVATFLVSCMVACGGEAPPPAAPPPLMTPPPTAAASGTPLPVPSAPMNPLFEASTLLYQAPPFDRIHDADYQPAIEEGMEQHLAEVAKIASQADAPTFDNTIVAMERSGRLLDARDEGVLRHDEGEHERHAAEGRGGASRRSSPRTRTPSTSTPKLYARVKALYDHRDGLDAGREVPGRALPPRLRPRRAPSCRTPTRRSSAR